MEPFLGIMLDSHPRPTHAQLRTIFQSLYEQMMNPIEGLSFGTIEKHLTKYDPQKLEKVLPTIMKTLAATLSRQ